MAPIRGGRRIGPTASRAASLRTTICERLQARGSLLSRSDEFSNELDRAQRRGRVSFDEINIKKLLFYFKA